MKNVKPDELEDLSHVIRNQISITREALLTMEKEINTIANGCIAIEKALREYRKKADDNEKSNKGE